MAIVRSDDWYAETGVGDNMLEYKDKKLDRNPPDLTTPADANWHDGWTDYKIEDTLKEAIPTEHGWAVNNETAEQWNQRMSDKAIKEVLKGATALDSIRGKPKPIEDILKEATPALERQAGGTHYKDLAIQPVEYCVRNGLGMCESNVVKYVTRHAHKGGKEDIHKAIHMLELLLELKY
jgi:hypothetical protein